MSGGGGQTSTNKWEPWSGVEQPLKDYIAQAQGLAAQGYSPYEGQTVANLTPMLGGGLQMLTDYAMQGTPERSAAGATLLNQMQGQQNPYSTVANPYMGDSEYLRQMIGQSNQDITDAYGRGVGAQTDSAAARSGAFGGSAYQEQTGVNQRSLADSLARNTSGLLQGQYERSGNMAENALNRATQGYESSQNRALQGASVAQGQQGLDLQAIQAMIQGGQIPQQYQQQLLDAGRSLYEQQQQVPFTMSDFLRNALATASGGFGQGTQIAPGQNPMMGLLGAGMAGYGMFGGGS